MSIAIEAAELMEHFQWLTTEEVRVAVQKLDAGSAVLGKLQTNEHRYPVDEFRIPPQVGYHRRPKRERVRLEAD